VYKKLINLLILNISATSAFFILMAFKTYLFYDRIKIKMMVRTNLLRTNNL